MFKTALCVTALTWKHPRWTIHMWKSRLYYIVTHAILLFNKKGFTIYICNNRGKSQDNYPCEGSQTKKKKKKKHTMNDSIYTELCCCCITLVVSDSVWPHRQHTPGSPVPGILQARTLERVAISFSIAWKWKVKVKSLSCARLYWHHGLQPTRLLHPWDFLGKSTGVGCHCLLHTEL